MSEKSDSLISLLKPFGLSPEESKIYLHLLQNGIHSALTISRQINMARTKVYRILDNLYDKKLIFHKLDDIGIKFGANTPKQLELLIIEKEQEAHALRRSAPLILQQLEALTGTDHFNSQVRYYKGKQGLEQVTWNSTKAKDEIKIYEVSSTMDAFLDSAFAEKVRSELLVNQVHVKQLTNQLKIAKFTEVRNHVKYFWEPRYLNPKDLLIQFEVLIYDDVYTMYSYEHNDIFCVEIYNSRLAEMQKQLFNFIWKKSKKMKVVNAQGQAHI